MNKKAKTALATIIGFFGCVVLFGIVNSDLESEKEKRAVNMICLHASIRGGFPIDHCDRGAILESLRKLEKVTTTNENLETETTSIVDAYQTLNALVEASNGLQYYKSSHEDAGGLNLKKTSEDSKNMKKPQ